MIGSIRLRSLSSSPSFSTDLFCPARSPAVCKVARGSSSVPKLEPFSRDKRSKIDRGLKEPSFIQKSEKNLTDYCSMVEGDESYSCWRAYFELKDLEKELPKEDVEKFLRQAGGVKSTIDCLHGLTAMQQRQREKKTEQKKVTLAAAAVEEEQRRVVKHFHVPDGLPKTAEEIAEEERAMMPDSPFTRMLRSKGTHPAWYSEAPDHETD